MLHATKNSFRHSPRTIIVSYKVTVPSCLSMPLMKQHLAETLCCRRRRKLDRRSTDQHLSMLCFYENMRTSNFFVDTTILTEGAFVTEQSSNAGIHFDELCGSRQLVVS
jgi:hypothetical protein